MYQALSVQKLVAVVTIFISVIIISQETAQKVKNLNQVFCVSHLVLFKKKYAKRNYYSIDKRLKRN